MHRLFEPVRVRFRSALALFSSRPMSPTPWVPNTYPPTHRSDHVDTYKSETRGDVKVPDPYNWLEQNSEDTDKWTSAQEQFTRTYLDKNPDRKKLEDAFRKSMDYPKVSSEFNCF